MKLLDEVFDQVARAKANAERNAENARELFESYLQSVFASPEEDWKEKSLDEVCEIKHGFAFKSKYFSTSGKYVLLTPGNFFEKGGYRDRGEKQKYYKGEIPDGFILKKGDLLVAMTEQAIGLLGSPIIVPDADKFLHNQRLGLVKFKQPKKLDAHFLFYLFNTERVRNLIEKTATGVKVRHTSPKKLLEISFNMPPLATQKSIVAKLDALSAETKRLECVYRQKAADLDELKRSVLRKAFAGEL